MWYINYMEYESHKAFLFARRAHRGITDKSDEPYILHPLRVAKVVAAEFPGDDVMLSAAFLHDTVEDTKVTLSRIHVEFGAEVAHLVDLLSKRGGEKYFDYIKRVGSNAKSRKIKIADTTDNLREPFPFPASMRERYTKALKILRGFDATPAVG